MVLDEYFESVTYHMLAEGKLHIPLTQACAYMFDKKDEFAIKLSGKSGLAFLPEEPPEGQVCFAESGEVRDEFRTYFTSLNLLDYIYAVLYSSSYRDRCKNFPKISLPNLPLPEDTDLFWKLTRLGETLRLVHLLGCPAVEKLIAQYPAEGSDIVDKIKYEDGKVYINSSQYFSGVSEVIWNLYMGKYRPAQEWLKKRKGVKLVSGDIRYYQKILAALAETVRLTGKIDNLISTFSSGSLI